MESAKPSVYTKGNQEGMDRVMKEDGAYAFFMEEAALKYYMARNCELTQIGGLLDNKGYGVGLPLGMLTFNYSHRSFIGHYCIKREMLKIIIYFQNHRTPRSLVMGF